MHDEAPPSTPPPETTDAPAEKKVRARKVHTYPSKILRMKCKELTAFEGKDGEVLHQIADEMANTINLLGGVAMAAPQGGLPVRLVVIRTEALTDKLAPGFAAFVNPTIVEAAPETVYMEEGCLSFPGVLERVGRPAWVVWRYQGLDGTLHPPVRASGFAARIILHELAHLDGKLMIDLLSPVKRDMVRRYARKGYQGWQNRIDERVKGLEEERRRLAAELAAQEGAPRESGPVLRYPTSRPE